MLLEFGYYENCINYLSDISKLKVYNNTIIDVLTNNAVNSSGSKIKEGNEKWQDLTFEKTSIIEVEEKLMKRGYKYNSKKKLIKKLINRGHQDDLLYEDLFEYVKDIFRRILNGYEDISINKADGEYQRIEEALITGEGSVEYTLSRCLKCNFFITSRKYDFNKVIELYIDKNSIEDELIEEIKRELNIFSYKMKLIFLNEYKVSYELGKTIPVYLHEKVAAKLMEMLHKDDKREVLYKCLSPYERRKDINNILENGIYIDECNIKKLESKNSVWISVKNAIYVKQGKPIGLVDNINFIGSKYEIMNSIKCVGYSYKWYKEIRKVEDEKIIIAEYGSPSIICSMEKNY